ncbi:hypothetical protein AMK21_30070 [Streptomyces sp. CB00316]|uniref:hypothetical protein n=1 Tax=Streptomyces sp. CB00316 TaxID=1703932 RepID=UPI00093C4A26|nr:hypothetical protein [Streptomyces sp. CB00316]OKJ10541.1 hypothetical protein AMK21_30070 [Streptomyces sp. CB00316]
MNPDLYIAAGAPSLNPYPILISGVAFNVIVVLVAAWYGRRHAVSLHRETLNAQSDELAAKARHDLAAERRETQYQRHEAFVQAVSALDFLAYTYTARPHSEPLRAIDRRGYSMGDVDAVTAVLTTKLAGAAEKVAMALENIRLASSPDLHRQAWAVYVAVVQTAYRAEWVGRMWSQFPDHYVDHGPEHEDSSRVDDSEVAEYRARYEEGRGKFHRVRNQYVAEFQAEMWGDDGHRASPSSSPSAPR